VPGTLYRERHILPFTGAHSQDYSGPKDYRDLPSHPTTRLTRVLRVSPSCPLFGNSPTHQGLADSKTPREVSDHRRTPFPEPFERELRELGDRLERGQDLGIRVLIGKKRRRPGRRAPPCELRATDLAATTASDGDEARNTQARDRRGSTRPRSSRDRSRRTVLGRLRRLEARQPLHSLPLRRRWTRAASPTNRIGVSWVIPLSLPHEFAPQVPRHSSCLVFPGTSEWRSFLTGKSLPGISDMDRLPPRNRLEAADAGSGTVRLRLSS
jgi:hypothetical protein